MSITLEPIGRINTPYREKFAIPRQPGLVKSALGVIQFTAEFNDPNFLRGIEQYSHLWLLFHFHQTAKQGYRPLVRPPRLGGNKKLGVFATRSTFRPNSIGMSVVEFVSVQQCQSRLTLTVRGVDLLDGTPILDIKPYVPYADNLISATGGIAQQAPKLMPVRFSASVLAQLALYEQTSPHLKTLISEVLEQDPRPAYHKDSGQTNTYGMSLYNLNIQWQVIEQQNLVVNIRKN